ncbi:hypothetical protein HYFRA_00008821 [Hymenoscyphus fraxineus]|uniref:Pheromone a factor receptor n=1 Tax=Hymenoscyphus fraxineus TaxID=746836 RepID=A0A9N9L1Q9_9HELO|nr:hypothetical protein HYFRA_00008821 [Hymenoscyphus fraxineus]
MANQTSGVNSAGFPQIDGSIFTNSLINPHGIKTNPVNAIVMPIFNALGIVVLYLPMRDFYRKGNFAACSMIAATVMLNLYQFLDAVIWQNDDPSTWFSGVGLCDIQGYSRYMFTTALLTTIACFIKNLADVFNTDNHVVAITSAMKRKKLIVDILFCWLLPVVQVIVHYMITLGRFAVFPVYGCYDEMDNSWPYIVVYLIWGPIFTLVAAFYGILLLRGLYRYRSTISITLASSGSGMNSRYFVKVTMIAIVLLLLWIPCQFYYLKLQIPPFIHAYSWSAIHDPEVWNPIAYYPTALNTQLQYNGWSDVAVSFVFFCFFGFNNDAIDTYREWMVKLGFAKCFPSLTEPRHPPTRHGSSVSGSSLGERLDIVGKAMRFFDGSRKGSQATDTATPGSPCQSRKGSHGTFCHASTCTEHDLNTHLPRIPEVGSPHLYPSPHATKIVRRPLFATLRTHINLPFPLFPFKNSNRQPSPSPVGYGNTETLACERCGYRAATGNLDLEAQSHHPSTSSNHVVPTPHNVVLRTDIWSDTGKFFDHVSQAQENIDREKRGLKMGTRAYREREEREYAEEVGESSGNGRVVVEKMMERRESEASK